MERLAIVIIVTVGGDTNSCQERFQAEQKSAHGLLSGLSGGKCM